MAHLSVHDEETGMTDRYRFKELGRRLSNWGRWGNSDERGTLNHITPEITRSAASSVRSGKTFELSIPVGKDGPQAGQGRAHRVNPIHVMNVMPPDFASPDGTMICDDYIIMPLQSGTQWDGLAHVGYDGKFYNGAPETSITAIAGAEVNAIDKTLPGVVGRGVLLDVARYRRVDWLDVGDAVGPAELDAVARAQGVEVRAGDIVLVRTGWRKKALADGWTGWLKAYPGLNLDCAEWFAEHDIAAVASDNGGVEIQPGGADGLVPLHCVLIRDMGMMLGEMFDLEELAEDCAADSQYDFFFSAPPLRVVGGTGSPVSPIAVK